MITVGTFRLLGRYGFNILSGVFLAAVLAHLFGKIFPSAQLPTFIVLSVAWVLTGVDIIIREARGRRDSPVSVAIGFLPTVVGAIALVVLVASVIGHFEPVAIAGPAIGIVGTLFCIGAYAAVIVGIYRKQKLEEDLANKPESSNPAMQPTAGRRTASLSDD